MILYHRATVARAKKSVASNEILANTSEPWRYRWGPFFFVATRPEIETGSIQAEDGVDLYFECGLIRRRAYRTVDYMKALNTGRDAHLRRRLILEFNPSRPEELRCARIVPDAESCLKLIACRAGVRLDRADSQWCDEVVVGSMFSVVARNKS